MATQSETVLLFEKDQDTRELYRRELSRVFKVLVCTKIDEAFNILQNNQVSAIILEPAINDNQGWAFLAMLNNTAQTRTIPVILCSTLDERRLGFELGASCYLIKPTLPTKLCSITRQVINSAY